jgi:putative phosphoribosyl transferase
LIHIDETRAGGEPVDIPRSSIRIPFDGVVLDADIGLPESARGVVLFAHGSGSGRHSPRNRLVAEELHTAGLATVLADLLTPAEERVDARTAEFRFDIGLLAERVIRLADWLVEYQPTADLGIGLFGASTGAAAALVAAAVRPTSVQAVVSRGGRPDLAGEFLPRVRQPTLLIVGQRDATVLELNRAALAKLSGDAHLEIVPGASHLFEEPGTLHVAARLARDWFVGHLTPTRERHDQQPGQ